MGHDSQCTFYLDLAVLELKETNTNNTWTFVNKNASAIPLLSFPAYFCLHQLMTWHANIIFSLSAFSMEISVVLKMLLSKCEAFLKPQKCNTFSLESDL